jgi:dienelactone hydrolase
VKEAAKNVVILSDLWGFRSRLSIKNIYRSHLPSHWKVQYYDATILAGIPTTISKKEDIHTHFVNDGIDKASSALSEQVENIDYLIGLSIGGAIAWRYALKNPPQHLIGISATRLRKEVEKPNCSLELYYGLSDKYKPNQEWFNRLHIKEVNYINGGHDIYMDRELITKMVNRIR